MSGSMKRNCRSTDMTNQEIIHFKKEIGKYNFLVSSAGLLKDRIDVCLYQMSGVKGIRFDKVRGSLSEYQIAMLKHDQSEKYEKLLKTYEKKLKRIEYVESVLNRMSDDDRELYEMKYIEGMSFERLARINYISKSGLIYRMNAILKEL